MKRRRNTVGVGIACAAFIVATVASCATAGEALTTKDAVWILERSTDGRALKNAAVFLAASRAPEDHKTLGRFLGTATFLSRLDPPEHYDGTWTDLRLGRVVDTLAENRCPSSDEVLVGLIGSAEFQAHPLRVQILLRALAAVRPSPPQAIAYWDRLSGPESPITWDVIEALFINQSIPALDLLERKFADPSQDRDRRILWMRMFLPVRRNDEPLLLACERMVTKSLPADLRPALVEVLFDFRPREWYRAEMNNPPKPPPRAKASVEAKTILERIGRYALDKVRLTPGQTKAVKAALKELGTPGR